MPLIVDTYFDDSARNPLGAKNDKWGCFPSFYIHILAVKQSIWSTRLIHIHITVLKRMAWAAFHSFHTIYHNLLLFVQLRTIARCRGGLIQCMKLLVQRTQCSKWPSSYRHAYPCSSHVKKNYYFINLWSSMFHPQTSILSPHSLIRNLHISPLKTSIIKHCSWNP